MAPKKARKNEKTPDNEKNKEETMIKKSVDTTAMQTDIRLGDNAFMN